MEKIPGERDWCFRCCYPGVCTRYSSVKATERVLLACARVNLVVSDEPAYCIHHHSRDGQVDCQSIHALRYGNRFAKECWVREPDKWQQPQNWSCFPGPFSTCALPATDVYASGRNTATFQVPSDWAASDAYVQFVPLNVLRDEQIWIYWSHLCLLVTWEMAGSFLT